MRTRHREGLIVGLLVLVTTLVFGAIVWQMIYAAPDLTFDYPAHIQFARDMLEHGQFADIHILYQALMIGLSALLPIPLEASAWLITTAFYVITALLLYRLVREAVPGDSGQSALLSAGIALALLLVTPITLLTLAGHNVYFGYVSINIIHNPTMVILKPFALVLFVYAIQSLNQAIGFSVRTIVIGTLLVTLSLLAKPNFVLDLLPALLVVIGYRLYRRETRGLKTILISLVLPMIVLLALQYVATYFYLDDQESSSIIFAPLLTVSYRDSSGNLSVKFLLSVLFPALVYLLYRRRAIRDPMLNLAWLIFFAGAGQMYLFAESGERLYHGNFWWSAQIGLFILFVFSTLFWLRHFSDYPRWRGWLCFGIFALHLISGLISYAVQFQPVLMRSWQ